MKWESLDLFLEHFIMVFSDETWVQFWFRFEAEGVFPMNCWDSAQSVSPLVLTHSFHFLWLNHSFFELLSISLFPSSVLWLKRAKNFILCSTFTSHVKLPETVITFETRLRYDVKISLDSFLMMIRSLLFFFDPFFLERVINWHCQLNKSPKDSSIIFIKSWVQKVNSVCKQNQEQDKTRTICEVDYKSRAIFASFK